MEFNEILKNKSKKMIRISLASPEDIRGRSYGEVTKPETINYKSLKPEKKGLFDERIFGPTQNYSCSCSKYKKIRNKGKICERCGVEITEAIVRRERMGHIELAEPVVHIWMLKATPSRISLILNMKVKKLEEIVYFVSNVVLDPGTAKGLQERMVIDLSDAKNAQLTRHKLSKILQDINLKISEDDFAYKKGLTLINELENTDLPFSMDECTEFISKHTGAKFGIGASAIETLLKSLDIEKEIEIIKSEFRIRNNSAEQKKLTKRLETLNAIHKSKSSLEWMILKALPVVPPDIRPIIQLDGGRFTASEINELYRRIIVRNQRLKKIREMGAPEVIVNNEKRMLQEAVDALLDNERKAKPITGKDKRPLKSLTSVLKGKQGRFRQNLLGKRVDYSGRSVIVVGPNLKMYQCGLPRDIAIILFKPFVIHLLIKNQVASNIKIADTLIKERNEIIWDYLEIAIKERPVLLNRAPTLHRLGIQAFEPILVKGKAIKLHPLATTAFNADFDGDQMAVHLPISAQAVAEARALMLGSISILGPKDGKPIVVPTLDMVLGNYYLTMEEFNLPGEGTIFADYAEIKIALSTNKINLHSIIAIPVEKIPNSKIFRPEQRKKILITTAGKIIFNEVFEHDIPYLNSIKQINDLTYVPDKQIVEFGTNVREYIKSNWEINKAFDKKILSKIIHYYFVIHGVNQTSVMLDKLKNIGFKYSTKSGVTISAGDVNVCEEKYPIFVEADAYTEKIKNFYLKGLLTYHERKDLICRKWNKTKILIQEKIKENLLKNPKNPMSVMTQSGARGNIANYTQLIGMRGLMTNPRGEIIEIPIKSSFREGLNVAEFFISTHGARKGMADVALKTADSGYLTRRLVDVAQEIIITNDDCKATFGFEVHEVRDTKFNSVIVPLEDRLKSRFTFEDIDLGDNKIIKKNTIISEESAIAIAKAGIKSVKIRSVLTCQQQRGICQKCYGGNLASGELVEIGDAVGTIAAQSIGEPGTQLTMRTFHTGGVAGEIDITQGLPRIKELLDVIKPKKSLAIISEIKGVVTSIVENQGIHDIKIVNEYCERTYRTLFNSILRVKLKDTVKKGQKLTEGSIDIRELIKVGTINDVQNYILKEVQKVYRLQGIEIADKYLEIIIRQMLNRVLIIDGGESHFLPGEIININKIKQITADCFKNKKIPPVIQHIIFGIKKAPLKSSSFLSSASFQDTTRVLIEAIIKGAVDPLEGLKENIMLGNLIPAGTGLKSPEEVADLAHTTISVNEY